MADMRTARTTAWAIATAIVVAGCGGGSGSGDGDRGGGGGNLDPGGATGLCTSECWCWANPLPQGNPLSAIWGASDTDVWFAGVAGTVLHWNGSTLALVASGTFSHLRAISGASATDVWAVGDDGAAVHWDGSTWTVQPAAVTEQLTGVWAAGAGEAWAVAAGGDVLHYASGTWTPTASGVSSLAAVWGAAPDDVGIAGAAGALRHWDGIEWSPVDSTETFDLVGLWGSSSTDVWAIAQHDDVLRWDGQAWAIVETTTDDLLSISGSGPENVWVLSSTGPYRWNGADWTPPAWPPSGLGDAIWASASSAWVADGLGAIIRWNETRWTDVTVQDGTRILSIWSSGHADLWAAGQGGFLLRWNGSTWTSRYGPSTSTHQAVWGAAANDVWIGGSSLWHWNGTALTQTVATTDVYAIYGTGPADVWAATANGLEHWNGTEWSSAGPAGVRYRAIFAVSSSDVWAVGGSTMGTEVAHWNGTQWTTSVSDVALYGAWGAASNDVWFVGSNGAIRRWNGTTVTIVASPRPATLTAVFGRGADDVFAVGDAGTVLHWNGTTWSRLDTGCGTDLSAVFASGTNVWIGGQPGALLHGTVPLP
jgi:hypothetical protein